MISNAEYLIQRLAESVAIHRKAKDSADLAYWRGVADTYQGLLNESFPGWDAPGTTGWYVLNGKVGYDEALTLASAGKTEWLYNFMGGGWNTEWAHTLDQAVAQAHARWADRPALRIDTASFRRATPADLRSEMSSFY